MGYFDFIWSSPPCTEYSIAKQTGVRKIEEANRIVMKTIEIIDYFNPRIWFIENPQTGLLKKQDFMIGKPYMDVDYCKYGMPYRKKTRLWNNLYEWEPQPLCKRDCNSMDGNRHKENYTLFKQDELYRIPEVLIHEIFSAMPSTEN